MGKIFVISDTHYGLTSSGYSRTQEIDEVVWDVVEKVCATRGNIFIHCGDLGHNNHPKPEIYAKWISIWEQLHKYGVVSRFIVGNHDIVHDVEQCHGSLSPLVELKYAHTCAITKPRLESYYPGHNLIYLPYVSKSHLGIDPQTFIDDWLRNTLNSIRAKREKAIIFSHLNVGGSEIGSNRVMRPSRLTLPMWAHNHPATGLIVAGHIHLHQTIKDGKTPIVCIGSPIYTDFGDSGEKVYLTIEVDDGNIIVNKKATQAVKLVELNYDFVGYKIDLKFDKNQIENCIVKVNIKCTEAQKESIDFDNFRRTISEHARFVKPILPIVVKEEIHQPVKIMGSWSDEKMVEEWIRNRRPPNAGIIDKCAKEAMERS